MYLTTRYISYESSKLNLNFLHCSVRVGLSVDSNDDAGGQAAAAAGTLRDITQRFIFIHCFLIHFKSSFTGRGSVNFYFDFSALFIFNI